MTVDDARQRRVPAISVVVPTRDRPALVRRAVASALAQRSVDVEVIVVDDGSTERFRAPRDDRVSVIRHETPRGVAAARNRGVTNARSDWIAFLDDDDYWAPEKLQVQLDAAAAACAGFAYCTALVVADGQVVNVHPAPPARSVGAGLRRANLIPAGASNVLACTDAVRAVGRFNDRLLHLADWDLWSRLLEVTRPAASATGLVAYVQHPSNMHIVDRGSVLEEARLLRRLHRNGPISRFDSGMLALFIAEGLRQAGHHWRAAGVYGAAGVRHARASYLRSAASELARGAGLRRPRRRPALETPAWVAEQWSAPWRPREP